MAGNLDVLAVSSFNQGRSAEAEELFRRALAILERSGHGDGPRAAGILVNAALLYCREKKYAESERLYRKGIALLERDPGPGHPATAAAWNNFGQLLLAERKPALAIPLLERAAATLEKSLGPEHPDLAATLLNLARAYSEQRRYAEAAPLYQRALATLDAKADSGSSPMLVDVWLQYSRAQRALQNYSEAEWAEARAMKIHVKQVLEKERQTSF